MQNKKYWAEGYKEGQLPINLTGKSRSENYDTTKLYLCLKFDEKMLNNFLETKQNTELNLKFDRLTEDSMTNTICFCHMLHVYDALHTCI